MGNDLRHRGQMPDFEPKFTKRHFCLVAFYVAVLVTVITVAIHQDGMRFVHPLKRVPCPPAYEAVKTPTAFCVEETKQ